MRTTLNMVLELMEEWGRVITPDSLKGSRSVEGVTTPGFGSEETIRDNWVHVAGEREAASFAARWPDALIVCVLDAADACWTASSPWMLALVSPLSVPEVVKRIRGFVCQVDKLVARSAELFRRRKGFGELLQMSEGLIGNFISISDSAFQLIACTEGITQDDPATTYLCQRGHHDPAIVRVFKNLGLPDKWRASTEPLEIAVNSPVCTYPTVSHVFKFRHSYFVHMVMLCNNKPVTNGLLDMFMLLVELVTPFVERDWLARKGFSQPHDRLFGELLNGVSIPREELAERAAILHLPLEGNYQLVCVEVSGQDSVAVEDAAWRLVACFSGAWVTVYRGIILVVFLRADGADAAICPEPLREALSGEGARIGLSPVFDSVFDLKECFEEARAALVYGSSQAMSLGGVDLPAREEGDDIEMSTWRDGFVGYLLYAPERDSAFIESCLRRHPFGALCADDYEKGSNQAVVALTYLALGCKATLAAEALHMHRNNVLYHLGQIKAKYGLDLEDSATRFEVALVSRFAEAAGDKLRCVMPVHEEESDRNGC